MRCVKAVSIGMLLAAVALQAGEPQRRPQARTRTHEQVVAEPGTISRQGKFWVEEVSGTAPAAARIKVESAEGNIEVRGAAQPEISYRIVKRVSAGSQEVARRVFAEYPVRVRRAGYQVHLSVASDGDGGIHADYQVTVPKGSTVVELETRAGAINVTDVDGTVHAATAGGAIDMDRIGGAVEAQTAGGGITLGTIGGRLRAQTAGGSIRLTAGGGDAYLATAGGNIDVGKVERSLRTETAGGNITIGRAGGDVTAETAGGNLTIGEAGRVSAVTAGGSIQVDNARAVLRAQTAAGSIRLIKCFGPLRAETAAGSISAAILAERAAWGASELETRMGDIVVYLPENLGINVVAIIEMASGHHRITSDFPLHIRSSAQGSGRNEILGEASINGGGAPLRLRTTSGNIEIRKNK